MKDKTTTEDEPVKEGELVKSPPADAAPIAENVRGEESAFNLARIDSLIKLQEKLPELGRAMDKLREFVLARALPGDWVFFGEKDGIGNLELTGAGSERIAAPLGFSFINWTYERETWVGDRQGVKTEEYRYRYICTVLFQGRRYEQIEGLASSRDKFFGYAYGEWKELAEINESYIRQAARRNCMKEGVKVVLGLRRIASSDAERLGLPNEVARAAIFGEKKKPGGKGSSEKKTTGGKKSEEKEPPADQLVGKGTFKKRTSERRGKYTLSHAHLSDGNVYTTFDKSVVDEIEKAIGEVAITYEIHPKYGTWGIKSWKKA